MMRARRSANWPGGENLNFLDLHAEPLSFVYGYVASLIVSLLTIVWATRVLGKLSPRALLAGETTASAMAPAAWRVLWSPIVGGLGLLGATACLIAGFFVTDQEAKAGSFFGSGALLLFAFFMISDPKTTPDSRAGRVLFAALVAFGAWYVQFRLFRTNGLLWALAACSISVPVIDRILPGPPYRWTSPQLIPNPGLARRAA